LALRLIGFPGIVTECGPSMQGECILNSESSTAAFRALLAGWRSSALQRAVLALVMPTHKRHLARGLQLLGSTTYRRAKPFESDRPA